MKIKIFALIICSALIAVAVSACNTPQSSNTSDTADNSVSVSQSIVEKIEVNINVVNGLPDNSAGSSTGDPTGGQTTPVEPIAEDFNSVLRILSKSVVSVKAVGQTETFMGSGVVIASSATGNRPLCYIVTCHHLIAEAGSVYVTDYEGVTYPATFIGSDPDSDLCVMSAEAALTSATVYSGTYGAIETGESVVAIGNAYDKLGQSVTTGIVSGVYENVKIGGKKLDLLQTDAVINEGNSGGGLFTRSGYLIGIVDAKIAASISEEVSGLNFAVPSATMIDVSTSLMDTYTGTTPGYIKGKYNLGYTVSNYYVGLWTSKAYVYIVTLDETGSLFKAGLKVNDRIDSVEYKGETLVVTDAEQFTEYMDSTEFAVGDEIIFKITRGETPYTITVPVLQYIFGQS